MSNPWVQPDPTRPMWVRLDLCDRLDWVEFFWPTMVGWIKKSSRPNPTHAHPLDRYLFRENILSGAGRKGAIYATNQELPCQIHIEASVHSITQDCSSNKTKITKHILFIRSLYLEKIESGANASSPLSLTNGAPPRHVSCCCVDLSRLPRTKYCGLFQFPLYCLISYLLNI